ncbi:restriction endonuclease subunit S [Bacillus cereus]|uniref:restriction endonuclease subunit S n=1 Tax=Bacillus cereus group TaxID=86661 RepID=UPI000BFA7291|nr:MULTISPECIES: restriction endonuclease subunit S [Bacillus cereus group]MCU5504076.1 restriction endonuclease subunit S [Bacillus cereus]MCU5606120.1 restriction endonuclease subunit S [Bacillus cereus]PFD56456.1 restriction endonuclease subunit S [Bacillus thuringiensis]
MAKENEKTTFEYINLLRGYMGNDSYVPAALLVAETKEACENRGISDESESRIYEAMLAVADRLDVVNPFKDKAQFVGLYKAYGGLTRKLDWEMLVAESESIRGFRHLAVSNALFNEYNSHFKVDADTVLIAEGEKFIPNLKRLIDEHPNCSFTIATEHAISFHVISRVFAGYENVEILNASIYQYGFTNNRYDLIFSVPNFGTRNLAEDENFMCRDQDAVALENLLLHTTGGGELVITMPARITYAHGKNGELRRFVQQTYRVKEIAELPEGTFEGTGIKTYLIDVVNKKPGDDDVIVRRYKAENRKNRRDTASEFVIEEETFVMPDELEELGDWNINKIFSQQDEEWLRFQESSVRRLAMGDVAEIFRGKSVSKKDPTGSIGVVNISNIGDYDIDYAGLDHFDEEERKITNYLLKEGDVLIPARGTAIRTAIFHEQSYPCIASSNIIVIRPETKMLNSTYLKLFLDSPLGEKMISGVQQGSIIINISYKDLNVLEIPVPSIEKQQKKADEYTKELTIYKGTIAAAEKRWNEVVDKLREF